jgi:hypothetical protein
MSSTYSTIDAFIGEAVEKIAAQSAQLASLQQEAQYIVDVINQIVSRGGAIATELDARVSGDMAGNAAWEQLKARKDEVVADLQGLRSKANAILAAITTATT